ncbi:MAG: SDR family oxidoreductase [Gemmatimonadetes bacterium]|nr:SDR family oxidoreductase [Gemmatimonadota bacterium]
MRLDLTGEAGLVTGAAGGIGAAIAEALAGAGARVMLVDRREEVHETARRIGAEALATNLAADGACEEAVEFAARSLGRISLLVNAAGVQARGPLIELEDADWERLNAVNLGAAFRLCRASARLMISDGVAGSILNVASISASVGVPGIVGYGATKAGLVQLTRGLAVELAPHGIRANAIAPGYIRTAMTEDLLSDEDRREQVLARIPLGRIAEPEEIAPTAVFLLSRAASYVTGEVVHVDGGYVAR